jgi:hypothetical protein
MKMVLLHGNEAKMEIKNYDIHRWPKPAVARESPRCAMQDSLAV